jgi:hypothetical protein
LAANCKYTYRPYSKFGFVVRVAFPLYWLQKHSEEFV